MAALVLKNAYVYYNTTDMSSHCRSIEIPADVDSQDVTAMGSNTKHSLPGLKDSQIKATFLQDYAGTIDTILWPDYNSGTSRVLVVRPDAGNIGATNPAYTMTVFVSAYSAIKGKVGDAAEVDVTFTISSGDVVRTTS